MKFVVLALAAGLLGGCNLVTSHKALFTEADTAGGPQLHAGSWMTDDPRCRSDPSMPADMVKDCTGPLRVDGQGRLVIDDKDGWTTLVAKGEPAVMQIGKAADGGFFYAALRPTRTAPDGRVTAFSIWFVDCGPPPPESAKNADGSRRFLTYALAPGLEPEDQNCVARDAGAVRAAALTSEKRQSPMVYEWVRAGTAPGGPGPRRRRR